VVDAGKKVGTPTGMHTMDQRAALLRAEQGMQFIAIGSELRFMTQRALEVIRAVRPELGDKDLARY
jgi:4-hydroxy-2-oxoheptanedioate aldolase